MYCVWSTMSIASKAVLRNHIFFGDSYFYRFSCSTEKHYLKHCIIKSARKKTGSVYKDENLLRQNYWEHFILQLSLLYNQMTHVKLFDSNSPQCPAQKRLLKVIINKVLFILPSGDIASRPITFIPGKLKENHMFILLFWNIPLDIYSKVNMIIIDLLWEHSDMTYKMKKQF